MSARLVHPLKGTCEPRRALSCGSGLLAYALAIMVPFATAAQDQPAGEDTNYVQYSVDSDSSWLRVLVYRGGLLRGFGHNHVISHHAITGSVTVGENPLQSELILEFSVADLMVDDPDLRALAGPDFPGQIPEKDIAGTRANMLGRKLLQAEQFPSIQIRSEQITGNMPDIEVRASVIVRDMEFPIVFPARVELSSDSFVASGELEIRHAEIGLKPLKAALGTVRVRKSLLLNYEISGKRVLASE